MSRLILSFLIGAGWCAAQSQVGEPRQAAEQNFATRLQQDPNNVALLLKMGSMKLEDSGPIHEADARNAVLDEAQSFYERVTAQDANNVTALYSLGVVGWSRIFPELRTARAQLAMDPETPGPLRDRAVRAVLSSKYSRTINDSIASLERVLTIDPQSSDAMAYLNLVYRAKADLDDTPDAYSADINMADQWVQKSLETAKAKRAAAPLGAPPPPPPPPTPPPPGAIRVGGNVQAVNLIVKPDPVYPPLAMQARIQGTVRFNAVIAKDGTMQNLTVLSGHPMLVQAALQAVRQYVYKPTLLNGEPVQVITTIDVNFTLP